MTLLTKIQASGFEQFVGPITYDPSAGLSGEETRICFTISDQHLNGDGFLHGGMIMTLASAVLGQLARGSAGEAKTVPLSINCDFVGPGRAGAQVSGTAEITRRTRSVLFASAELRADDTLMMTATGVYRIGQET